MNSQFLSKERVLIVGCGDIGQRLSQFLSQDRFEITGLRRHPPEDTPFLHYQVCDVTDPEQLSRVLQQDFTVVVITMTPTERSDAGYQRAYVHTCRNLVASLQARSREVPFLIFVSSTAVYGQMEGEWVDENSPTAPESFSGKRLLEAEAIVQTSQFPHAIVRFSGIYGPGRNRLIEQVRQAKASASCHITNRIHAQDCARSLAHIIELHCSGKEIQPIYLATDSAPVPMLEVVSWLAQQMGLTQFISGGASNERGNKHCSNRLLLESGFVFSYPGYKDGYAEMLKQYR